MSRFAPSPLLRLGLPVLAWLALAGPLCAQAGSGAVGASAQLALPPLSGAGIQPLALGQVAVGEVVDVPPGPAAAGQLRTAAGWRFGNLRKRTIVLFSLSLPATLDRGAASVPVDWDNPGYGTLCVSRNGGPCQIEDSFNPASGWGLVGLPASLQGNDLDLTIYAGARATIPPVPPGVYSSTATLTMMYLF